jgi:sec-independent protein translocase protein TatC
LNYEKTIKFVFQLIFAFVVLFQIPLVLLILMAMDLVKRSTLLSAARYVIVGIFVISALATPPDIVSQVMLSVPLVILFYVAIFIAKVMGFGNDDDEPEESDALTTTD